MRASSEVRSQVVLVPGGQEEELRVRSEVRSQVTPVLGGQDSCQEKRDWSEVRSQVTLVLGGHDGCQQSRGPGQNHAKGHTRGGGGHSTIDRPRVDPTIILILMKLCKFVCRVIRCSEVDLAFADS